MIRNPGNEYKTGHRDLGFIPCTLETEAELEDTGGSSGEIIFNSLKTWRTWERHKYNPKCLCLRLCFISNSTQTRKFNKPILHSTPRTILPTQAQADFQIAARMFKACSTTMHVCYLHRTELDLVRSCNQVPVHHLRFSMIKHNISYGYPCQLT